VKAHRTSDTSSIGVKIESALKAKVTFYCPVCWHEVSAQDQQCSYCGSDLNAADARPLVEKLCSALNHPEGETAVRAAWILGERRETDAVPYLIRAVETAGDSFVVESAVEALGKIADPRAGACLKAAAEHGTARVRIAARNALKMIRAT
jgi:HEAT repeat protein